MFRKLKNSQLKMLYETKALSGLPINLCILRYHYCVDAALLIIMIITIFCRGTLKSNAGMLLRVFYVNPINSICLIRVIVTSRPPCPCHVPDWHDSGVPCDIHYYYIRCCCIEKLNPVCGDDHHRLRTDSVNYLRQPVAI